MLGFPVPPLRGWYCLLPAIGASLGRLIRFKQI
jgi:hypothetical protein